jgi:hypothetical protein
MFVGHFRSMLNRPLHNVDSHHRHRHSKLPESDMVTPHPNNVVPSAERRSRCPISYRHLTAWYVLDNRGRRLGLDSPSNALLDYATAKVRL